MIRAALVAAVLLVVACGKVGPPSRVPLERDRARPAQDARAPSAAVGETEPEEREQRK